MNRRAAAALVAAVLALAALPAGALAAGCPKTTMPAVESEVMCLQCGVPLNLAEDAPSARRERVFIQGLIDQCRSKQQIKDALVAQFGDRVLAEPKSSSAVLVPAIAFAAGGCWWAPRRCSGAAGGGRPIRPTPPAVRRRARPSPLASRPISSATSCDGLRRHHQRHGVRRVRGGLHLFISPCVLPLVPGYISAISGVSFAELREGHGKAHVLGPAVVFCLSFTVMFVALGMTATGIGHWLGDHRVTLRHVSGS